MERDRNDLDFAVELGALRPTPRPAFAAELDARAAAGFPQRPRPGSSALTRIAERLASVPMRRLLAPAGATAVAAIAIATAVVALNETGQAPTPPNAAPAIDRSSGAVQRPGRRGYLPLREAAAAGPNAASGSASRGSTAFSGGVGVQMSVQPERLSSGPYAAQVQRRAIERSAQLTLGAEPSEVRDDAARIFETVHSYNGIVLRSSIRNGKSGDAGATFDLLIPTSKLGDALAAFSQIAEVRSRRESTLDITAPTIGVGEHLQDARAKVEGLLSELANADTESEREAAEAELRRERRRVAVLRSRLTSLQRRAHLSHVALRIETGAVDSADGEAGRWGVDDALDGAGHILAVSAGVTLIGLAVLAPFAILALLVWLGMRLWRRRSRERALD